MQQNAAGKTKRCALFFQHQEGIGFFLPRNSKEFAGEVNTTDFDSRRRIYNVPIWKPDFRLVIELWSQSGQPSWLALQLEIAVQFLILPAVQQIEVYTRMKKLPIAKRKNRENGCFYNGLAPIRPPEIKTVAGLATVQISDGRLSDA